MQNPVNHEQFIQLCFVVEDIELAAKKWAELLNIPVPQVRINHLEGNKDYTYRGEEISCDLKVCSFQMGSFAVELHESAAGENTFKEYADNHKYGLHHIGFEVGDQRDAVVKELAEDGYAIRTIGYYPGSSWTIVDTEKELGTNLNIKPIR